MTGSKDPSLTAAAVPAEIAAAIAKPSSAGKVRASRRTPGEAMKASAAAWTEGKEEEAGSTSSAGMEVGV
jgi:hypothetical protein